MTNNQDALRCAEVLEQLPIITSFDGTLFAKTGSHNLDTSSAHIRRLVAENEAKDALLRQAVEPLEEITQILNAVLGVSGGFPPGANGPAVQAKEAITAIRQHLGQKGETG